VAAGAGAGVRGRGLVGVGGAPVLAPALLLALLLAHALAPPPAAAQRSHLLVVAGLGGEPAYVESFYRWGAAMVDAARGRLGLADSSVIFLAERPERDPARIRARSTKEEIGRAVEALAARSAPGDRVLVLLIGHGSAEGGEARLNLPGPDLTAAELAVLLDRLKGREVAVVNAASASGAFLDALAAEGRIVVTATRNAAERNRTLFAGHFVDAYAGDGADADRDGRVSLFEAFEYARREVARAYSGEGRLQTEHALLDGDGDGRAVTEPDPAGPDARAALAFVLGNDRTTAVAEVGGDAASDPALRELHETRRRLEREVAELRAAKDTLDAAVYVRELERLLLELARTNQAIRRAGGGRP